MDSFEQMLFAPLDRRYCLWFYGFMVFNFVMAVILIAAFLMKTKNMNSEKGIFAVWVIFQSLFMYMQFRMWYSMCLR
jgi:hypothetical protein